MPPEVKDDTFIIVRPTGGPSLRDKSYLLGSVVVLACLVLFLLVWINRIKSKAIRPWPRKLVVQQVEEKSKEGSPEAWELLQADDS